MSINRALFVTLFGRSLAQKIAASFRNGEPGAWYDPTDITTLFQDAAGTVQVSASGDPVRLMLDKSGRGNHATAPSDAARPVYTVSGTQRYLVANGSSSAMQTAAINLTATDRIALAAGLRKLSDAGTGIFMELSATVASNTGSFRVAAPTAISQPNYGIAVRGAEATANSVNYSPFAHPITNVISSQMRSVAADSAAAVVTRINGAANAGTEISTQATTGNFGNHALNLFARNGASLFFDGHFYGAILNARASGITAQELAFMERYINLNAQVTLA